MKDFISITFKYFIKCFINDLDNILPINNNESDEYLRNSVYNNIKMIKKYNYDNNKFEYI